LRGAWEAIDTNKATAQVLNQAKSNQQGVGVAQNNMYQAKV
jgi:flagellar protein FliS